MGRSTLPLVIVAAVVILGANVFFGISQAFSNTTGGDSRSLRWDRFDVLIDNFDTAQNRFDVTETYQLRIEQGPFSFGTMEIPMDRLTGIQNLTITDGGTRLRQECTQFAGTFCATREGDNYAVTYYFTSPAHSGTTRHIEIKYTVYGALRSYEGGDELFWVAVPEDRPFPVVRSQVTVQLPNDRPAERTASYPDTWKQTISDDKTRITWESPGQLDSGDQVEVRVEYQHDPRMEAPPWQDRYDLQRTYEEQYRPVVSLLLVAFALAIAISGVLFVGIRYTRFGRDPKALVVPEYLTEPPTDEQPGIVGLLLDERADMQDIMATLVDLARRGYFVIEQTSSGGVFGMFEKTDFEFHRTDKDTGELSGYEQTLLRGLFGSKRDTSLSQLRNKFYTHIPAIKQQMYSDLVAKGYFKKSPESTRQLWAWGGIALMVIASLLFWGAVTALMWVSPAIVTIPIAIGLVGFAAAAAADTMPAKTLQGAQDAARWRAFKRYLKNIGRQSDLVQADEKFDRYLPYAIAMGIEDELVRQLTPMMTSMPRWYHPTYLGGPWHSGYRGGASMTPGGGVGRGLEMPSFSGPGGLNQMSQSLTEGLNAMNSGLTRMLNDAARAMTSKPSSSGRGGGFSGGGGGGGGSGGGSRGFG